MNSKQLKEEGRKHFTEKKNCTLSAFSKKKRNKSVFLEEKKKKNSEKSGNFRRNKSDVIFQTLQKKKKKNGKQVKPVDDVSIFKAFSFN